MRFSQIMDGWEATASFPDSPFKEHSVKYQIFTKGGYAPKEPSKSQLELVERVRKTLPELAPLIAQKLQEYYELQGGTGTVKDQLCNPVICLFSDDDGPDDEWSFAIDRPDTPGDPAVGDGMVYFVRFHGTEIVDVYAGT
jgi:hypothetical protein